MKFIYPFLFCLYFFLLLSFSLAKNHTPSGLEIMKKQDQINRGFKDEKTETEMILKVRDQTSIRKFEFKILENAQIGDKTLFRFIEPADIRNTVLLTHENKTGDDNQWIYLPALKRTKRIAAKNKSASFVGSEFTYEDMTPHDINKYEHQYLKTELFEDHPCYVVESIPKYDYSGYSKVLSWIRTDIYQTIRQDFYDKKSKELFKRSKMINLNKFNEKYWRANEIHMKNLKNNNETKLRNLHRFIGNDFQSSEFSKRAISR